MKKLARLVYDGCHPVGEGLAGALIKAAKQSVGTHHGEPYQLEVRYACEDIDLLRQRLGALECDIERRLVQHEVGKLLTTLPRTLTVLSNVSEILCPSPVDK